MAAADADVMQTDGRAGSNVYKPMGTCTGKIKN